MPTPTPDMTLTGAAGAAAAGATCKRHASVCRLVLDAEDGTFAAAKDADLQQDDEARDLVAEGRGARAAAEASVLHMVAGEFLSSTDAYGRRPDDLAFPSSVSWRMPADC